MAAHQVRQVKRLRLICMGSRDGHKTSYALFANHDETIYQKIVCQYSQSCLDFTMNLQQFQ